MIAPSHCDEESRGDTAKPLTALALAGDAITEAGANMKAAVLLLVVPLAPVSAFAGPWPSFRGSPHRTAVTDEQLRPPLGLVWTYQASHPPSPAFKGGLRDAKRMTEAIAYDYAFHTVVADGRVYFGSSTEEAVFCLNMGTGEREWAFHTEGPVRLAPTLWNGRVYFGSDDGNVYCLDGNSGALVWKFQAAPDGRRCIGNRRIISAWPVRTGVTVVDGTAFFASGILPPHGVYLYALSAETGSQLSRREIPYSPNGQILIDGDKLWLPTGRTCPAEFGVREHRHRARTLRGGAASHLPGQRRPDPGGG